MNSDRDLDNYEIENHVFYMHYVLLFLFAICMVSTIIFSNQRISKAETQFLKKFNRNTSKLYSRLF